MLLRWLERAELSSVRSSVRSFQPLPTNDVVGGAGNASIDRPQSSISPLAIERARARGKKPSRRSNLRICFLREGDFLSGFDALRKAQRSTYTIYLSILLEGVHCVFAQRSKGE